MVRFQPPNLALRYTMRYLVSHERIIIVLPQHWIRPVVGILAGGLAALVQFGDNPAWAADVRRILPRFVPAAVGVLALWFAAGWLTRRLLITDKRLIIVSGLVWRRSRSWPLGSFRVDYTRGPLARILGYGSITLLRAGRLWGLWLWWMSRPDRVYLIIMDMLFGNPLPADIDENVDDECSEPDDGPDDGPEIAPTAAETVMSPHMWPDQVTVHTRHLAMGERLLLSSRPHPFDQLWFIARWTVPAAGIGVGVGLAAAGWIGFIAAAAVLAVVIGTSRPRSKISMMMVTHARIIVVTGVAWRVVRHVTLPAVSELWVDYPRYGRRLGVGNIVVRLHGQRRPGFRASRIREPNSVCQRIHEICPGATAAG